MTLAMKAGKYEAASTCLLCATILKKNLIRLLRFSFAEEAKMQPSQIEAVQASFAKVQPIADAAAKIFYARLFEIAPEVKSLFTSDIDEQGRKLMMTLGVVVNGLTRLDEIVPVAQKLAIRHVDFGVRAEHYRPVGNALLWTLEKGLGDEFTPEVEAAWSVAYTTLSGVMISAAYPS